MSFEEPVPKDKHEKQILAQALQIVDVLSPEDLKAAALNSVFQDILYNDGQSILEYFEFDEESGDCVFPKDT